MRTLPPLPEQSFNQREVQRAGRKPTGSWLRTYVCGGR